MDQKLNLVGIRRSIKYGQAVETPNSARETCCDPKQRAPEAIARDIEEGAVTLEAAKRDYGYQD